MLKFVPRPFLQPISVYSVDIISCSHSLKPTLSIYHLTCCSSSVFCTLIAVPCCLPHHTSNLLLGPLLCSWSPVTAYLHHFSLVSLSLQLSGEEIQFLTSSFAHAICEFSLSLHCLTVTCCVFSTVRFFCSMTNIIILILPLFFLIDSRIELGWNFCYI